MPFVRLAVNPQSEGPDMADQETYHRTYLPDGSYGPNCNPSHRPAPKGVPLHRMQPLIDPREFQNGPARLPDGTPLPSNFRMPQPMDLRAPKPVYKPGQLRWKAMRYTGPGLMPTWMVEKPDQDFARVATPFERDYSKLVHGGKWSPRTAMEPVVEGLTVIGHVGRVNAQRLWIPIPLAGGWGLKQATEEGIPVYMAKENPDPSLWTHFGASEVIYDVLTGIDGEVVACLGVDYVGLESVDFWLLDAVTLGFGLANLGIAAGKRILKSLTRRAVKNGGSVAFQGATREIAKDAIARMAGRRAADRAAKAWIPKSGMTKPHFEAFQEVAERQNVIAIVRNTNERSTRLIEMGCPGKPFAIKFHTSEKTGVVVASNAKELKIAYEQRYFVVDADGVARRPIPGQFRNGNPVMEEIELKNSFWQVEQGQLIDPRLKKPVVGDYDLMGVVDPTAPGRNIALHVVNDTPVANVTSPIVERFQNAVNQRMDMPRVLHGAQDQFAGFRGGATAFLPDGTVKFLPDEAAVEAFYKSIGRETIRGAHPRPAPSTPVVDELAARRAQRAR
jgi:hypothetical protein